MSQTPSRKLFVNLPVENLDRSVRYFTELGFRFDPRFTDENATCMLVGEDAYVMLLVRSYFRTFTTKPVTDTPNSTECMLAVSAESREAVDTFASRAISMGGSEAMPAQDLGFMYSRSFYDLDGHHWEVMWMDPKALEA